MRFEFKLRIGSIAVEASDYDNFIPFQITVWRYNGSHGHSVCSIGWKRFNWHGWKDKAQICFTCKPRVVSGRFVPDPEEEWDDIVI